MISFIVSAAERPMMLACCLASLQVQKRDDKLHEIIVCDNSEHGDMKRLSHFFEVEYRHTYSNGMPFCYYSPAQILAHGDWLCFPSDDSYYVPQFAEIMLKYAALNDWEFVYCDVLYDPRLAFCCTGVPDKYSVMETRPSGGGIDKTCFLVTRRAFDQVGGWPERADDWRDGALAEALVTAGIRHGKAPGVMVVHN